MSSSNPAIDTSLFAQSKARSKILSAAWGYILARSALMAAASRVNTFFTRWACTGCAILTSSLLNV